MALLISISRASDIDIGICICGATRNLCSTLLDEFDKEMQVVCVLGHACHFHAKG